jgi:hypothetical protein
MSIPFAARLAARLWDVRLTAASAPNSEIWFGAIAELEELADSGAAGIPGLVGCLLEWLRAEAELLEERVEMSEAYGVSAPAQPVPLLVSDLAGLATEAILYVGPAASSQLEEVYRATRHGDQRFAILRCLADIGDPAYRQFFLGLTREDVGVSGEYDCVRVLQERYRIALTHREARTQIDCISEEEHIREALRDVNAWSRLRAIDAIIKTRISGAHALLASVLADSDPRVSSAAREALQRLADGDS